MAGEQKTAMPTCLTLYLYKCGSHGSHHCFVIIFTFSKVNFILLFSNLHKPFPSSSSDNLTSVFTEKNVSEKCVLMFHHHIYKLSPSVLDTPPCLLLHCAACSNQTSCSAHVLDLVPLDFSSTLLLQINIRSLSHYQFYSFYISSVNRYPCCDSFLKIFSSSHIYLQFLHHSSASLFRKIKIFCTCF